MCMYTVVQKKNAPTLADYNYDPVHSILIIFSKLFVNDHKSCLVVKFSTSPHIYCHYTLWNTMLYFALITLLIANNEPSLVIQAHRPPDLWPSNSPDLNPVDYTAFGAWCSSVCTRRRSVTQSTWRSASFTHGPASCRASLTKPLTSGQHGYAHAWRQKVASSNICSSN